MKLISNYPKEIFEIAYNFRDGKVTLKDLNKAIEETALNITEKYRNKFKGDMFEIFAWVFFKAFKNDPSVGLVEYTPIDINEDYGVDGVGTNAAGNKVAVQVKYRHNPKNLVLYTEIAKTYTSGRLVLKLGLEEENSIYVFTNAMDVRPSCKEVFRNIVKVLNADGIDHYVHNNKNFWNFFYERVQRYLDE